MTERKTTHLYYVDSDKRLSGSSHSFLFETTDSIKKARKCVLLQASIPKSYYTIPVGKNEFKINDTVITLTPQNYNYRSFVTEFNTKVQASFPNITIARSTLDDGKYKFTTDVPFTFTPTNTVIPRLLGMESASSTNIENNQYSTNCVSFTIHDIYIGCDFIRTEQKVLETNILAMVPVGSAADYQMVDYINPHPNFMQECSIPSKIQFSFYDSDENALDFNGVSVNLVLGFEE